MALHPTSKHLRLALARLLVLLAFSLSVAQAQTVSNPAAAYDADVATAWFTLALELVKETPGFTPPVASRAFGYLGVTLYETVVPGMPEHQSLAGQLNELQGLPQPTAGEVYHWPAVASAALAHLARGLFANAAPENLAAIDGLEAAFASTFEAELNAGVFHRSSEQGQNIAEAIYTWSLTDGGHEGYARNFSDDYAPPTGLGMWISTPPAYAKALQPSWDDNRPFVLSSGAECAPTPPPGYAEEPGSDFYAQGLEVYETVLNLTPEQRDIALFWADEPGHTATPSGHWISILTGIIKDGSLALAAEAYAKLGIATADAFIACWYTKYRYNVLRPISYIQRVLDPGWNELEITDPVITPPFPEYTSGHSVQSAAAAHVLTDLLGDNFAFTDTTHTMRGYAPRSYGSFHEAAQEAAVSRLYGGIHYRAAVEEGLVQGRCIGERIVALDFRKAVD